MSPLGSIPLSPLSLLPEIFDFFFFFLATLVFVAAHQISLVSDSGYCSLVAGCAGFSLRWLLLLRSTGSKASGIQWLECTSLVALRHVGSSWIRYQIPVRCTGRQVLNCTPREALCLTLVYPSTCLGPGREEPLFGWGAPASGDLMHARVFVSKERRSTKYKVLRPQADLDHGWHAGYQSEKMGWHRG